MDMNSEKPNTVLIIEDSPFQAKLVRKHIETVTLFKVLIAHTMHEAEALLREHAQHLFLALIDLNLEDAPDGEAVDLCLTWNVPSLVLTARFDDTTRARCIERRVVDYFFKGSISDMDPMIASIERVYKNQFVTALAVDDSRAQRGVTKHLLEVQRISVLEADSGEAALEILDAHPEIRLIVTDFQMPGMGGLELVRQARARTFGRAVNHRTFRCGVRTADGAFSEKRSQRLSDQALRGGGILLEGQPDPGKPGHDAYAP